MTNKYLEKIAETSRKWADDVTLSGVAGGITGVGVHGAVENKLNKKVTERLGKTRHHSDLQYSKRLTEYALDSAKRPKSETVKDMVGSMKGSEARKGQINASFNSRSKKIADVGRKAFMRTKRIGRMAGVAAGLGVGAGVYKMLGQREKK